MVETMTEVQVLCPSCSRAMGFENNSWRCLACNPIPMNIPICKTQICKQPLTKLEDPWNCWICLKCNKHPAEVNAMRKEDDQRQAKYLDTKVTEDRVNELIKEGIADGIRAAMAELNPKPFYPPTTMEITQLAEGEGVSYIDPPENVNAKPETYLQKAKRLGVKTHDTGEGGTGGMRKKADIVADIESLGKKEDSVEDTREFVKAAQTAPGEDDEYARGLTAKDMMT